jgi:hypothetical protein
MQMGAVSGTAAACSYARRRVAATPLSALAPPLQLPPAASCVRAATTAVQRFSTKKLILGVRALSAALGIPGATPNESAGKDRETRLCFFFSF